MTLAEAVVEYQAALAEGVEIGEEVGRLQALLNEQHERGQRAWERLQLAERAVLDAAKAAKG